MHLTNQSGTVDESSADPADWAKIKLHPVPVQGRMDG